MNIQNGHTLAFLLLLAAMMVIPLSFARAGEMIPFGAALDAAAITQPRLDSLPERSLILGNGDINALLYQTADGRLGLRLTKNDVWDARIDTSQDPPLPTLKALKEFAKRDDWFRSGPFGGLALTADGKPSGLPSWEKPYPCPRPCGELFLGVKREADPKAAVETRAATLDIRRAVATIQPRKSQSAATVVRALAQRNVFLIQSEDPVSLSPATSPVLPAPRSGQEPQVQWLTQQLPGDADWPGMSFAVAVASGKGSAAVAIVTSLESKDVLRDAIAMARQALAEDAAKLVTAHEAAWQQFWSASGVEMDDAALQAAWYRNLYFLRCVSKPGVEAVGLFAGLMTDGPCWHGGHTTNYNAEQTFWASYITNHVDLAQPYERLITEYLPRAKWLAQTIYGCGGAFLPHNLFAYEPPDPAKCRSKLGRSHVCHTWGLTLGVSGFCVQNLWWHYKYQPDRRYLQEVAYPAVREVATFYADLMDQCETDAAGKVVLAPTVSAEHWGWSNKFSRNRNCALDLAMARFVFAAAIEGAKTLECDADLAKRFAAAAARLPAYPTTAGAAPIVVDVQDAPPVMYNIPIPSTPVYPGEQVTFFSDAAQRELFTRTIAAIQTNENNSGIMLPMAHIRLGMADAYEVLRTALARRSRPNGTIALSPMGGEFNDFGHYTEQFAASMAISELMLQSVGDVVRVFPAWPTGKGAQFRDLRAQGGFLISARFAGNVKELSVTSTVGGRLRMVSPWPTISVARDGKSERLTPDAAGIVELPTQAGQKLTFKGE